MNEDFLKQIISEVLHAQGEAFGLLVQALCRQVDAAQLKEDLKVGVENAKKMQGFSSISEKILQSALAAAQAEAMLQANERGARGRPN